ncbi:MAG: hypothetical protein AAGJ18_07440, partial [Bacteroidota bacterium]
MNKIYFLLPLAFYTSFFPLAAQQTDTTTQLIIQEIIPVMDEGFVICKADNATQPFTVEFSFYNTALELVSQKQISTYQAGALFSIEKVFVWNNKLILHGAHYLVDAKKNQLFHYEFSLPNLDLLSKKLVLLSRAPEKVYVPYFSKLSPDKSKLVLLGWDYTKGKENAYVRIRIIDQNLREIRRQTYRFPYENRRISIEDVLVDNSGNVYLTGNNYNGSMLVDPSIYRTTPFVTGLFEGNQNQHWEIEKLDHHFQTFQYTFSTEAELVGIGLCEKKRQQGSAFFKVTPTTEKVAVTTYSVDKEQFITAYKQNSKFINPPEHTFNNYELRQVLQGGENYFLVAEHLFDYLVGDLLVLKLDKNGKIIWSTRVPKSQDATFFDRCTGVATVERAEKLYFLFNDNADNYKKEETPREIQIATVPDLHLASAAVDLSTGKIQRRLLKNIMDENHLFLPFLTHAYGQEAVLI